MSTEVSLQQNVGKFKPTLAGFPFIVTRKWHWLLWQWLCRGTNRIYAALIVYRKTSYWLSPGVKGSQRSILVPTVMKPALYRSGWRKIKSYISFCLFGKKWNMGLNFVIFVKKIILLSGELSVLILLILCAISYRFMDMCSLSRCPSSASVLRLGNARCRCLLPSGSWTSWVEDRHWTDDQVHVFHLLQQEVMGIEWTPILGEPICGPCFPTSLNLK